MFLLNTINSNTNLTTKDIIEYIYYISQIASTIILFLTARYAKKQYESQKTHARISQAAELAKHFKNSLIPSIELLQLLKKIKDVENILDKIDLDKIKSFDKKELDTFITSKDIKIYKAALAIKLSETNNQTIGTILKDCLNDLEYFCINFNSDIADSNTVYQSLHQGFFTAIELAYIFIAFENTSSTNKYYTNTIAIFLKWRKIYTEQKTKEENLNRKYTEHCDSETVVQPTKLK